MGKHLLICGVLLLAMVAGTASARTWYVRKDGTGDYTVIQDAVDKAAAGDTVRIGPGRYEEKKPYTSYPSGSKWAFDVYVAVNVSSLTLIGSGAGQTIIGPPTRIWVDPAEPKVICALSRVTSLVVEDLSMENVYNGAYRSQGGTLIIRRCSSHGCESGVITWSDRGTLVEDCQFQDIDYGVLSAEPSTNVTVTGCSFTNCMAYIQHTTNAIVSNCSFSGYAVGCQMDQTTTGLIYNCTFADQTHYPVVLTTGARAELDNNRLLAGWANIIVSNWSQLTGSGNELAGGSQASLWLETYSTASFHGNQILHGTGPSVYLNNYVNLPVITLDLSDNYWGTMDANQIVQWIWDGSDDSRIKAIVQFQPFSGDPIATESKSWGEVKTLYGR